jgi:SAM-dependent methyltransferase
MYSIYDFSAAYDYVMARDPDQVPKEVDSIHTLLARRGVTQGRILELACGACAHGIPLAQRGHHVTGIDRSAAMLAAAQERSKTADTPVTLVQADIVDFDLNDTLFDCAIFMYETFPVITEYDHILRHFAAVRRHMRPGGLYIIDLDARKRGVGVEGGEWGRRTIALPNGHIEIWHEDFPGDWVQNTSHLVLHGRLELDGQRYETVDDWRLRAYNPWDLTFFVETLAGWRLDGFYSWRDLSANIAEEAHYWMVLEAQSQHKENLAHDDSNRT